MKILGRFKIVEIVPSKSLDYFSEITNSILEKRRSKAQVQVVFFLQLK